jgi:hypothetical protein
MVKTSISFAVKFCELVKNSVPLLPVSFIYPNPSCV